MMASQGYMPGIIVYHMVYIKKATGRQSHFVPIGILFALQHFQGRMRLKICPISVYLLGHIASVVSINCSNRSRGTSAPAWIAMP